jgi:FKBP-type peptidyl-prolyl cis-trans isomerase 2
LNINNTVFNQGTICSANILIQNAPAGLCVGDRVKLSNGIKAKVTKITAEFLTIDANPPLAGKDLEIKMTLNN